MISPNLSDSSLRPWYFSWMNAAATYKATDYDKMWVFILVHH